MGIYLSFYFVLFQFIGSSFAGPSACPASHTQAEIQIQWECKNSEKGFLKIKKRIKAGVLLEQDYFLDSDRPYRRDVFQTKYGSPGKYYFEYLNPKESHYKLKKIRLYDFDDRFLVEHKVQLSQEELLEGKTQQSSLKPKVIVVDSGFNYLHPWVKGKHFYNEKERLNGKDDDGDGLVDNITRLNGVQAAGGSIKYQSNIDQEIILPQRGAPFTHGAFVASVAMKGIDHTSYLGVGGDIHSPVYLYKILQLIQKYDVAFTNMSFGFGDRGGITIVDPDSIEAVEGIMRSSYKTLHVVAAGNASRNFDEQKFSEYPACLNLRNKITVGALDTDRIVESELKNYKVASFSNRGFRCVDLMAPGVGMLGAGLGALNMKASGTSVASPYILNVLLKIHEILPGLKVQEYKSLLLKTVYVPEAKVMPVKSGGTVFPRRAVLAAQKVAQGLALEEAIWAARSEIQKEGELKDRQKLEELWKARRL